MDDVYIARRGARATRVCALKLLRPGLKVELVGPRTAMLAMQHQTHFDDLVRMQQAKRIIRGSRRNAGGRNTARDVNHTPRLYSPAQIAFVSR